LIHLYVSSGSAPASGSEIERCGCNKSLEQSWSLDIASAEYAFRG
jgi:hypothetical protein